MLWLLIKIFPLAGVWGDQQLPLFGTASISPKLMELGS